MPNLNRLEFGDDVERVGFTIRRVRLGPEVGVTRVGADAVIQPDANKIGILERAPGGIREWHRRDAAVPYFEDVPPPEL